MTETPFRPPSTRRSLAARMPGLLGRSAEHLRRAAERGDPRLGLFVGIPLSLLLAWAFVAEWGLARRAESVFLDFAFMHRPAIPESDVILHVDMDDTSLQNLPFPISRQRYAEVLTALDRLGARQVVFDVEFKMNIPRELEFDEETGEYFLQSNDDEFHSAIVRCGRATLAYHVDLADPLPALRPHFDRFKEALAGDVSLGEEEIARRTGLPAVLFRDDLELLRHHVILALAADRLASNPGMTFAELRKALLPRPDTFHPRLIQHAYWVARMTSLLQSKGVDVRIEGLPARPPRGYAITPPLPAFAMPARDGGFANAEADADGVLRRPWVFYSWQDQPHFYLGFMAGLHGLAGPGERVEVVLRPQEVEVRVNGRVIRLPMDEEGRLLVSWAGNRWRNRKKPDPKDQYFTHLSFLQALIFYDARYKHLDKNTRRIIDQLDEDTQKELGAADYVMLSDRLSEILKGRPESAPGEARAIEAKLDEVRGRIRQALERDNAVSEAAIPRLMAEGKTQVAKRTREALEQRKRDAEDLRAPYDRERELRKIVEGKICFIGSVYTATGDLHSTPLGVNTPGVDMHSNVANMLLTGQSIRRSAAAANFVALFGVGLLVTLAVVHWHTLGSAVATAGVMAVSVAAYYWIFVWKGLLVPGAGPVATSIFAFASVTAFKELVVGRSKRKLQRELEKNTSPEMVKILMEHPEFISRPRSMSGTFFFSDVKAFTTISEKMTPDVLFPFINRMLDRTTQALKRHKAYIDKYVGDGVVALFGLPVPSPDHARNACLAALDCQAGLKLLNEEFAREGLPQIKVRIGVNSGDVKAGNMGAVDRSSYTAMGDAINLASRLEGANKSYDTYIMIGESTLDLVRNQFVVRELDLIRVVGKKRPVRVYELIGPAGGLLPFDPAFLGAYASALEVYQARRWRESIEAFERALKLKPGDRPCENYIARAGEFLVTPPPADWEGVFELHSK